MPRTPCLLPETGLPRQILDTDAVRYRIDLPALIDRHDMCWSKYLPSDPLIGAPIGNGDFGALIHQQPASLSFALGKTDVWDRVGDTQSYRPGRSFEVLREAYRTGDQATFKQALDASVGVHPEIKPHLTTCGTLTLHLDEGRSANQAELRVGLRDGIARLTYAIGRQVEMLVSRAHDVMLIHWDRGHAADDKHPWGDHFEHSEPANELAWAFARAPLQDNPRMAFRREGDYLLGVQAFSAGGGYAVAICFDGFARQEFAPITGRAIGRLDQPTESTVNVWITLASFDDADDPEALCVERLRRAMADGAENVRAAHLAWWENYWRRGLVAIDDAEVEKTYFRGLYLTGSMLRPGKQSPGLQGVWCSENFPLWWGDYHSNINIQSIYWQLFTNNRLDLLEPYLAYYQQSADHARADARDYFNLPGLIFPHAGSIGGHEISNIHGVLLNCDIGESVWVLKLFWDYYRYTLDHTFLSETAYPLMRDVVAFAETYLIHNPTSGYWDIDPSVNFEGGTGEDTVWGQWGRNSQWATTFLRLGFRMAREAAAVLGVDQAEQTRWAELESNIAPFPSEDGIWKEFEDRPINCGKGHNFLLAPVFPAELVSAWHGPEEWQKQALATWRAHVEGRIKSGSGQPWCGGQGTNEILRLGETDLAFERSRWSYVGLCENGFNVLNCHWPGAGIQADHGPGMARMAADLVLLEAGGVHRLFAGIPASVSARFHSLRGIGGVLVSSERRGSTVDYVVVQATVPTVFRLAKPWHEIDAKRLDTAEKFAVTADEQVIEMHLTPDMGPIALTRLGASLSDYPVEGFSFQDK